MVDIGRLNRGMLRTFAALLCLVLCLLAFCSCMGAGENGEAGEKINFLGIELDVIKKYIELGQYKGLDVAVGDKPKDDALWDAIENSFKVKEYPISQVYYYRDQLEAEYKYYAKEAGISYEELCSELGVDSGDIFNEAKSLTKSDLVYAAIVKLEGISITEEEKERLFDKYVEKFVSVYGFDTEYVKANMEDDIYETMLYDKTTEFLLKNNNVTE